MRHMGTKISQNTFPACRFYEKSPKCTSMKHPQEPKAVKMGQSKSKFFPDGGLSSKLYIYILDAHMAPYGACLEQSEEEQSSVDQKSDCEAFSKRFVVSEHTLLF